MTTDQPPGADCGGSERTGPAYTEEETRKAADALARWFRMDTWTIREGLLLLSGIDPWHAETLKFTGDCTSMKSDGPPLYSRIGDPPRVVWPEGDSKPRIDGVYFCVDELLRLHELMDLWHRVPGHAGQRQVLPEYFALWAESKGLAPFWLEEVRRRGWIQDRYRSPEQISVLARQSLYRTMAEALRPTMKSKAIPPAATDLDAPPRPDRRRKHLYSPAEVLALHDKFKSRDPDRATALLAEHLGIGKRQVQHILKKARLEAEPAAKRQAFEPPKVRRFPFV